MARDAGKIVALNMTHRVLRNVETIGGAVAEWSKALLWREKMYENQKISGSPPCLGKEM